MRADFSTVEFTLDGVEFVALNASPQFKLSEAVSFVVMCDSQAEVNYYWEKLTPTPVDKDALLVC